MRVHLSDRHARRLLTPPYRPFTWAGAAHLLALLATLAALWVAAGCNGGGAATHPLDPLTERELQTAVGLLRAEGLLTDSVTLVSLVLAEPGKTTPPGPRRAEAALLDRPAARVIEVLVDLEARTVGAPRERRDGQPPVDRRDTRAAIALLNRDSRWAEALSRRGLRTDDVTFGGFPAGVIGKEWETGGHRLVRIIPHYRSSPFPWAVPVEGIVGVVDVTRGTVIEVLDAEPVPLPPPAGDSVEPMRERSLAPMRVAAPDGAAYRILGHAIEWDGWRLRWALHPREGLVLYDVEAASSWSGAPAVPLLSRASIAELVVPYGHPSEAWAFRALFDAGEFGLGKSAASLVPGEDVPANATLLDAVAVGETGQVYRQRGVVAVYERDGGVLWRHQRTARRARELVVRFVTTVGNYDYGFSWVLGQDGSLAMEIDLTGVLMVKGVIPGDTSGAGFGTPVAPGRSAIVHEHYFTFRLDFDVGGQANRVVEVEARPQPRDSTNPWGTAFAAVSRVLSSEATATSDPDPTHGRIWRVEGLGPPGPARRPGYILMPGPFPRLMASPDAPLRERAAFVSHALWVTGYHPDERYPAGDYPSGRSGGGLPRFVADDEPLEDADLVVWYTTGGVHFPRPEEWPRMPVARIRFEIRPSGILLPPNGEDTGSP